MTAGRIVRFWPVVIVPAPAVAETHCGAAVVAALAVVALLTHWVPTRPRTAYV